MIYVIFEDNVDLYFARARVLERMSLRRPRACPPAWCRRSAPTPPASATSSGTRVESPTHSLRELRTLQDWFVRYQLNAVPGVAEVASVGGHVQQYQIDVDPNRLRAYSLPLSAVVAAVRDSNVNVGGNVLESNGAWLIVRGVGLDRIGRRHQAHRHRRVERRAGLRRAGRRRAGRRRVPGRVAGQGHEGSGRRRRGRAHRREHEGRSSTRSRRGSRRSQPGLPAGVTIVPFYDRSELIEQAVGTLRTRADRGDRRSSRWRTSCS